LTKDNSHEEKVHKASGKASSFSNVSTRHRRRTQTQRQSSRSPPRSVRDTVVSSNRQKQAATQRLVLVQKGALPSVLLGDVINGDVIETPKDVVPHGPVKHTREIKVGQQLYDGSAYRTETSQAFSFFDVPVVTKEGAFEVSSAINVPLSTSGVTVVRVLADGGTDILQNAQKAGYQKGSALCLIPRFEMAELTVCDVDNFDRTVAVILGDDDSNVKCIGEDKTFVQVLPGGEQKVVMRFTSLYANLRKVHGVPQWVREGQPKDAVRKVTKKRTYIKSGDGLYIITKNGEMVPVEDNVPQDISSMNIDTF